MRLVLSVLAVFSFIAFVPAAASEPVAVRMGERLPRIELIKPGVRHYLRYRQTDETISAVDVISMNVAFEDRDGKPQLHVTQHWDLAAPQSGGRTLDSWFEPGTFRPSTHIRRITKDGVTTVEGFLFQEDRITGLADLPDNTRTDYNVDSSEPAFNFETDLLFLQALPLAPGYAARIVFHHPGGNPPAPFVFAVSGAETLTGPDGRGVECWIVTTDYNRPERPVTSFWIAKDTQQVIKVVTPMDKHSRFVKTLIW